MNYTIWLFISSGIPLLFIWTKYSHILNRYKKTLLLIVLFALLIHVPWDVLAVHQGLWSFPKDKNFDIILINLPLEEWLYTIFVPLLGASIMLVVRDKLRK